MAYYLTKEDYLSHHGILGQKWGVRRFENPDGTLTPEGKERYESNKKAKIRKAIKIGAAVASAALVAYGAYKVGALANQQADTILKGRIYLQKAKMDKAFEKFDYRSKIAVRAGSMGQDISDIKKDVDTALNEYNQHKNIYTHFENEYRKSSNIKKIKDAYNLVKFNKAHGTNPKDAYNQFKNAIPESARKFKKQVKKSKPLSAEAKRYIDSLLD